MRRAIIATALLVLSACASTANTEATLESWMGHNVDDLVASWGPPDSVFQTGNGGSIISYFNSSSAMLPGTPPSYIASPSFGGGYNLTPQGGTAPIMINRSCRIDFTITPQRQIVSWAYEGNGCAS